MSEMRASGELLSVVVAAVALTGACAETSPRPDFRTGACRQVLASFGESAPREIEACSARFLAHTPQEVQRVTTCMKDNPNAPGAGSSMWRRAYDECERRAEQERRRAETDPNPKKSLAGRRLERVALELRRAAEIEGSLPSSLRELEGGARVDPWGRELAYWTESKGWFVLCAAGPDGEFETLDDMCIDSMRDGVAGKYPPATVFRGER